MNQAREQLMSLGGPGEGENKQRGQGCLARSSLDCPLFFICPAATLMQARCVPGTVPGVLPGLQHFLFIIHFFRQYGFPTG